MPVASATDSLVINLTASVAVTIKPVLSGINIYFKGGFRVNGHDHHEG